MVKSAWWQRCKRCPWTTTSLWSNVLGQLPMASLASMVSKQFKNGSTCTTCTAIDISAKKNSLLETGFFLHLHCIVMGLHCLKLPQYLHILFFYWKLVFVHYCGLQSSKDCAKSQGWWLSGIALVWDPGTSKKVLGSNPLVCRLKKPCYPSASGLTCGVPPMACGLGLLLCFKEMNSPSV